MPLYKYCKSCLQFTWRFPCVGTGKLQPNTKEKPMFRLGELVEFRFYGDGLSIRIVQGIFKLCRQ
ncbi:MAG: DUF1392 family protein [Nostoc sp.]|uniref:DUF1392 family protein n=1 Tax=Nostoc sp. TaxID=1180 RepID=UPI002FFB2A96